MNDVEHPREIGTPYEQAPDPSSSGYSRVDVDDDVVVIAVGPACSRAVPLGGMVRRPSAILRTHGMGSGSTPRQDILLDRRATRHRQGCFSNLAGNAERRAGPHRLGFKRVWPGIRRARLELGCDVKKRCKASSSLSSPSPGSASAKQPHNLPNNTTRQQDGVVASRSVRECVMGEGVRMDGRTVAACALQCNNYLCSTLLVSTGSQASRYWMDVDGRIGS